MNQLGSGNSWAKRDSQGVPLDPNPSRVRAAKVVIARFISKIL